MLVILVLTGVSGFFVSWALLKLGLSALWIRYPLAVAVGYGVFLLLLGIWLARQRRRRGGGRDDTDLSDLLDPTFLDMVEGTGRGADAAGRMAGAGGRFGGAGASGSFQGPAPLPMGDAPGGAEVAGSLLDLADEDTVPLVIVAAVLAAVASLFLALGYLVWTAPALLAEILVDSLVVAALSHRLNRIESRAWVRGVLRRTWLPATGIALLLGITGYLLQRVDPTLDSIGDVARLLGWG